MDKVFVKNVNIPSGKAILRAEYTCLKKMAPTLL